MSTPDNPTPQAETKAKKPAADETKPPKPPKPTKAEIYDDVAHAITRSRVAQHIFGDIEFPERFYTHEVERGELRILEEMPGQVVRYVKDRAVQSAVLNFGRNLPYENNTAFKHYRFTVSQAKACAEYWMDFYGSRFKHEIAPVLQKSQAGWTFHRLPFDAAAMPTPLFDDLCAHICDNGAESLLGFLGMLFDPKAPRQQYLWLWGPGGDGKGTLLELLRMCFGAAYAAVTAGKHLKQDKFLTSRFLGCRLGAFPDCHDPKFVQDEIFMMLTGGDAVHVEKKGKDGYTTALETFFVLSSNSAPQLTGSPAHRRRAVVVRFRKREYFNGDRATYLQRLWEEMPGILWRAMETWATHKRELGCVKTCEETLNEVIADSESYFAGVFEKYFHVNKDIEGNLTPLDVYTTLREYEKFNPQMMFAFKKYAERQGVAYKERMKNGKRIMTCLYLHLKMQEVQKKPLSGGGGDVDESVRF